MGVVKATVVPPRDCAALRTALERLLADRDFRARLGAEARERARALFAWSSVGPLTITAYEDALVRTV